MRKHYILWRFTETTTPEQIAEAFGHVAALQRSVDGLLHVRNGENLAEHRSGGFSHFTEMHFVNADALAAYYDDPGHYDVSRKYTVPIAARAVTFDFDEE